MVWKVVVGAIVSSLLIGALLWVPASAKGDEDTQFGYGYRPGWGFGDGNNIHNGPPGLEGKEVPGKGPKHNARVETEEED